ncbi:MAG: TonB-dependent receptor [Prevotella sp.]|nr:TonB-dependent receptor [Prevotella sp.]
MCKSLLSLSLALLAANVYAEGNNPLVSEKIETIISDSSRVQDLDEVIVISQPKESFLLRQQPISSSMFSATDLQNLDVRDLRELSAYVPSFTMPNYGSRYTSSMYVRGIGSRVNSPAVGIYMDGMPIVSKSAFNVHSYQLERIDVLRGPQGTLYGQNTEGGLIRMYSRNPMNYQGTDINLGIGTGFYRNAEISHFNKVSDKFAFSLSGFYNGQNGFFKNQTTGERADKYNEAGGKLRLVFRPTDRWNINYIADYQYVRQNGFPYGLMNESGETSDPSTNRQSNYRRNIFNTALDLNFRGNYFDFNSTSSYQYLKDYMMMDIDYDPVDYMQMEERQFQNAFTQEFVLKSNRPSIWHWTLGAFGSFQWLKTWAPVHFGEGITTPIGTAVRNAMYNAMLNSMAARMAAAGMPMQVALAQAAANIEKAGGVSMDVTMEVPGLFHTPTFNVGFFHESNIDITDRLRATLGLRYDYTHVKIDYDTYAIMSLTANVMGQTATNDLTSYLDQREHDNFDQLLPKVGLSYRIDDAGSNIYATWSKGYRAGGYNIQMFSDILQTELNANSQKANRSSYDIPHTEADYENMKNTIAYKPETSQNFEFGTHLNLFNNSVQFDFSGFYMRVQNQQLSVMAGNYGYGRMMVNAGKSYSCGVEAALRGNAFDNHLSWLLNYSYTRAVFKEYKDSVATSDGGFKLVDYKDKRVPFVPEHAFSAAADYRFDISSTGLRSIVIGANVNGQGKTYWDEDNLYSQKLYVVLGAHADANFGPFTVSVWGRNLTDSKYNTFAVSNAATGTKNYYAQRGNPLQVGVDFRLHLK